MDLKRILICTTLLILIYSSLASSVSAQVSLTNTPTGQTYENDLYKIRVTIPSTWRLVTHPSKPEYLQLSAYSPTRFPVIMFIAGPHTENTTQNNTKSEKPASFTNGVFETKIEDKGETNISGHAAKWSLSFTTDHASIDTYSLIYFIPTEKQDYVVSMLGNRKNYEKDRKEFDDVIKTISLLP
jgi:hypothetical protein